jgi:Exoribonuclease R
MQASNPPDLRKIADEAMEKYGFLPTFPKSVISEVNNLNDEMRPKERRSARDLRSLLWVSIDNHDTMDIDQIQFCEKSRMAKYR